MNEKTEYEANKEKGLIPPRARNISELEFVEHAEKIISSNNVTVMEKAGKNNQSTNLFFFKKHNSRLAELEAYCGSICQFIAGEEYVPSTRPYYDKSMQPVGVASKKIEGFESNYKNPLKFSDTLMNITPVEIDRCIRIIEHLARQLIGLYNLEIGTSQRSTSYAFLEDNYHAWFDTEATVYFAKTCILEFMDSDDPYSEISLNTLLSQLQKRRIILSENHDNCTEQKLISHLIRVIQALNDLYDIKNPVYIDIEILEKLDKAFKGMKMKASDELFITQEIDGCSYTVSQMDMHNYRILKGQAVSLTTSYIFKNGDDNNSNRSKKGQIVDFDWVKSHILIDFKKQSDFNELFRRPIDTSFACDEYNIQYFPDVDDPTLFYWPTKQPDIHKRIFGYMTNFLTNVEMQLLDELQKNEKNLPLRNIIRVVSQVTELMASLNPNPETKTTYESAVDLFNWVVIQLTAFKNGRSAQELLDEEQLRYFFTTLREPVFRIKTEISEWASHYDKTDLKSLINGINEEFAGIVLPKINQMKTMFENLSKLMHEVVILAAQHPSIMEADTPLLDTEYLNFLFEGFESFLLKIQEETNRAKVIIKSGCDSIERNAFSLQDNQVFKSLSLNPVFIFHKYKTFLKYVLTDADLYYTFARLNIGSTRWTDGFGIEHNLHKDLLKDEAARIQEIKNTLISMEDFKQFLEEHGTFAFELLKEEFICARYKYQNKTRDRQIYNELVKSLDIDLITGRFDQLCRDCDLDYLVDVRLNFNYQA